MSTEIVVTGASGFVGRALIRQLLKDGFSVTGLSRRILDGLMTVANYADAPVPDGAILIHLAQGRTATDPFDEKDIELCRTLSEKPWRHIVFASSSIVYGDAENYFRSPSEPLSAFSHYSRCKLACEEIVSKVGGTCLRLSNLYGPDMNTDTVIYAILSQIPGEGPLRLKDTQPIRDFLWLEDAIRCIISSCQVMPGEILNAGSGNSMAVGDVARLALTLAGESSRPVVGADSPGQASCLMLDITKTQSLLNWSPNVDISTGISSLLYTEKNAE